MKFFLLLTLCVFYHMLNAQHDDIRINQVGYYLDAPKIAIIVDVPNETDFDIIDESENSVFSGPLSNEIPWDKSGETVKRADFSTFSVAGKYRVKVGESISWPFEIRSDAWRQVAVGLMKSYYLQRASYELEEDYAGIYKRPPGHPDTLCILHPSSGKSGVLSAPGGWYDAGDFGKYIVSAGVSMGNIMSLTEILPEVFPDGSVNIPESGNSLSDVLDEVKYELDWFKHMQDEDGGVFVKITSEKYPDMMFPHNDPLDRNVYGKSTASTLHFTAVMAMAARLYKKYDRPWSEDCLKRAEIAWQWAVANNQVIFRNPPGVLSGAYSNRNMSDEFLWAAAELFTTTDKEIYKQYLIDHKDEFENMAASGWANVNGLAITGLATQLHGLPDEVKSKIKESLLNWSDRLISDMNKSAYRIPEFRLVWGSNGFIGSTGLCFVYAFKVSGDKKYLHAAAEVADYILGKNATGYCFVTGFGSRKVVNLHHSVSIADGIEGSLPGFVPGGPNPSMQDAASSEHGRGAHYDSKLPAKAYTDDVLSYASNENDICYSAPVLALIAALDNILGEPYPDTWEKYYKFPPLPGLKH
ncbi:glycoside hydrolase family 9 protein [Bacteroidota bacterium]